MSRFFATATAFGLTGALATIVAITCGVVEPEHRKLAWAALGISLGGVPAASWWIVTKTFPAVVLHFTARSAGYWVSSYVLSTSMGNSWFSVLPSLTALPLVLGWLELRRQCYLSEATRFYVLELRMDPARVQVGCIIYFATLRHLLI
jgi:hypothetical protein